jgi:hypothetical protein
MKEEQGRHNSLVMTRCNTLATLKVLEKHPYLVRKDDLSSTITLENLIEWQIKQIVNKDDKKRMFYIPSFNIKGQSTQKV